MKKNVLTFITLLLFVLAQGLAITHVYGSKHLYHEAETTCSECAFLSQCSGVDLPTTTVASYFDFASSLEHFKPVEAIPSQQIYAYFSQAPPLC